METVDVAVIGGGVVGLASALAISSPGRTVCVLERHRHLGAETSTHNSGVIHAGLYYPANSLKARLCVEGRDRLYEFCARCNVPHARCGKLVVAHDEAGVAGLETLRQHAVANGVDDVHIVGGSEIKRWEPHVHAHAALVSPSSGIVEAETLVRTLARLCAERDVILLPNTLLVGGDTNANGLEIETSRERFQARAVVNAAGLYADEVSVALGGQAFTIYPCRGEYAEVVPSRRDLIRALVYPLPLPSGHGLGTHFSRNTGGELKIGPTSRYQEAKDDYETDREPIEAFFNAARVMVPELRPEDLRLGGSGIRAKLHQSTDSFADFLITRDTNCPRLVQAAGIDSPGLTSSLAIGQMVAELVEEILGGEG